MSLCTLVYVSIATETMTDTALLELLTQARHNNISLDITGLLLYRDHFFIQALEGEEDAVTALFEHVKQDARHYNVLCVYQAAIDQRQFPQWTMGFAPLDSGALQQITGFSEFMQVAPDDLPPELTLNVASDIRIMLNNFRQ
jgi:hypothetical protein